MKRDDIMNKEIKYCELDPNKVCDNCNKCNICDLDPNKLCDSCGKCIDMEDSDYTEIKLEGIIEEGLDPEDYIIEDISPEDLEKWKAYEKEEDNECQWEYIEDIPELKEEYDKKIEEILTGNTHDCDEEDECECHHEHTHNHHNCNCKH